MNEPRHFDKPESNTSRWSKVSLQAKNTQSQPGSSRGRISMKKLRTILVKMSETLVEKDGFTSTKAEATPRRLTLNYSMLFTSTVMLILLPCNHHLQHLLLRDPARVVLQRSTSLLQFLQHSRMSTTRTQDGSGERRSRTGVSLSRRVSEPRRKEPWEQDIG